MPHLLIVDDDTEILSLLTDFFRKHSHTVSVADTGVALFAALERGGIDLVILDVMLRQEDGFFLCRKVRETSKVPIIMLTAAGDLTDRIVGLEVGADDYVTKPFDQRELLARVKAVLRRIPPGGEMPDGPRPMIQFDDWRLDVTRRELRSSDDTLVVLSGSEFDLLLAFAEHANRVLTRDQLLDLARGPTHEAYDRSIDTLVSRLRRKLEDDSKTPVLIRTVRNGGYMFMPRMIRRC
jgi:two-component system OmpR family response regulator